MPVGGIAMAVGGGILVLLGVLARMGVLTRQRVVGLRTEATMASDEAWQAAHQSAAIWVVVAGIVLFLGGVQVMLADSETAGGVLALITTAAMLIPIGIAYQRGQAAARSSMKR